MELRPDRIDPLLERLGALLTSAAPHLAPERRSAVERWRSDAEALRFHLVHGPTAAGAGASAHLARRRGEAPPIVALIGGTGTGKSTLANRLIGRTVTAASFRRTFTAGPVALVRRGDDLPDGWLGLGHVAAQPQDLPARGQAGLLVVVELGDLQQHADSAQRSTSTAAASGASAAAPAPQDNGGANGAATSAAAATATSVAAAPPQAAGAAAAFSLARPLPTIIDTPDLDGDQPAHHAQADRVFRWAQGVVFLVTPEKYQMTELLPYYRLARRYAVPTVCVMNKCEEQPVAEDYERQLSTGALSGAGGAENGQLAPEPRVFAVPRDGSSYQPPADMSLSALRWTLGGLPWPDAHTRTLGLQNRTGDVLGRLTVEVLTPLREDRREADRMIEALRAMEAPAPDVDVNPVTQQLQRRLQQRSILYLMGPRRILDRVRQAPLILARLPRAAWDYFRKGQITTDMLLGDGGKEQQLPDFRATLVDQFAVLQSRIDDVLRSGPLGQRWLEAAAAAAANPPKPDHPPGEATAGAAAADRPAAAAAEPSPLASIRIDPAEAGKIADEELDALRRWLEQKWNATPRDTRMLESLLKYLPGGRKLSRWSGAAPYLLTIVLVTHGAFFGHLDLMVLGGYSLLTWITERMSNEVAGRTRLANTRIEQRFAELAHDQIERACAWLDKQAPGKRMLEQLGKASEELNRAAGL
jgi:hypothetical protein